VIIFQPANALASSLSLLSVGSEFAMGRLFQRGAVNVAPKGRDAIRRSPIDNVGTLQQIRLENSISVVSFFCHF
jgi:hypothetical protein